MKPACIIRDILSTSHLAALLKNAALNPQSFHKQQPKLFFCDEWLQQSDFSPKSHWFNTNPLLLGCIPNPVPTQWMQEQTMPFNIPILEVLEIIQGTDCFKCIHYWFLVT